MKYNQAGNCPRCGAPIFSFTALHAPTTDAARGAVRARIAKMPHGARLLTASFDEILTQAEPETLAKMIAVDSEPEPQAHYTCPCRLSMPGGLPELPADLEESTDEGDRRTLARGRKAEPESSERAG